MTRADLPEDLRDRLAFSAAEVGRMAGGISADTVRNEVASGRLRGVRVGNGRERSTIIIPVDSLLSWLNGDGGAK